MIEARLLTTEGSFVTQITVPSDTEPPAKYSYSDREFNRDRSIEIGDGHTVWIYVGPPEPPTPDHPSPEPEE